MQLSDLIEKAADARVTPRFVRYLIAENVLSPPNGNSRGARYNDEHLQKTLGYLRCRDAGLTKDGAAAAMRDNASLVFTLCPGLEIQLSRRPEVSELKLIMDRFQNIISGISSKDTP